MNNILILTDINRVIGEYYDQVYDHRFDKLRDMGLSLNDKSYQSSLSSHLTSHSHLISQEEMCSLALILFCPSSERLPSQGAGAEGGICFSFS